MSRGVLLLVLTVLALLAVAPSARPEPADYQRHIAAQQQRYGAAVKDLVAVVEPPFVVWGDSGQRQVQHSAERIVRWAVKHLEAQYFGNRPAEIHDIFLFQDAVSYERHALAMWGSKPGTPFGYASSQHRALVMNIGTGGGTLVHEMVHPYVAANFEGPPTWLNEGLASLYEQSAERDGQLVGLTNWRLAGLQQALKAGPLQTFASLASTTDAQFRDADEALHYAQARYLMLYLQERGLLQPFIRRAIEQQREDPTAATALRQTLGDKAWKGLDRAFAKWALTLRFPDD